MPKSNQAKTLSRYSFLLVLIFGLLFLMVRSLVHTTIYERDEWNNKADSVLLQTKVMVPKRGDILAADGSVLATTLTYYTLRIDYGCEGFKRDSLQKYLPALCDSLAKYYRQRTKEEWRDYILMPLKTPGYKLLRCHPLMTKVSHGDVERIKKFPFFSMPIGKCGLTYEHFEMRVNPYGDMARRSIGRVGEHDTAWVGKRGISGLERALDSLLYGKEGVTRKVQLTHGIVNWADTPAVDGYNIHTTIDIKMQDILETELQEMLDYCGGEWGAAVLMDVKTGDIKAITDLVYDPKKAVFADGINRAVLGYEPGSVIKTLSMMIAIEDGIAHPDEYINTSGPFKYAGGRPISDSHNNGTIKVREIIERSSNIGMTKVIARKYDKHPGGFYHRIKQTGFLEPFNTGLYTERPPMFDSVADNNKGRVAMARQCYGYASHVPPIYTLALYNAIANDGKFVRPRIVRGLSTADMDTTFDVTYVRDQICSPRTASIMRDMLTSVVWGDHGTARRLRDDRVRIAGKTGTCYMVGTHGYENRKRLAFCGFFPAENPKYSCVVLICNPTRNATGAASTSGEVLKNVALKLYSRGLLDNSSDYRQTERAANYTDKPTFYASASGTERTDAASRSMGVTRRAAMAQPKSMAGGVPDVRGYSLRDALATLETAGYKVTFSGSGFVAGQAPSPGAEAGRGTAIHLQLRE